MSASIALRDGVVFRELPFCGVLLDIRSSRVYRLSQPATAMLRLAMDGGDPAPGPYTPLIDAEPAASSAARERLIARLASAGLVRVVPSGAADGGERDGV